MEAEQVRLRAYRAEDLEAMYALDVDCFAPVFRFSRRAMRRFAEAAGAVTLVADSSQGELAGFCVVQMEGKTAYVVTLDVAAAWRRQGVARMLMEAAEEQVAAAGASRMELHVFVGNTEAVGFYERAGFAKIGEERAFYGRGLDALVYGKELARRGGGADGS